MSMISAQIDELRAIADKDTVPYEASDAMYQAADTIWQLRDDLQRTNAENAKLRELVRDMHAVISDRNSWWDCMCKDTKRFADRMRELGVEVDG